MKDLSFVFHVSTPNNEDVEPLLYKNWLAAADGMGGSGCMRHRVEEKYRASLQAVLGCVLPEYEKSASHPDLAPLLPYAEGENCYFARIFAPLIKDEVNTSARWASRIVMARFLYFLVAAEGAGKCDPDDAQFVEETEKFISRGLERAKSVLHLSVDNPSMTLLPTTFAALRYLPVSEEDCAVHALWAGDSRCYVLDAQGLRKLSADDEDESKLLTNSFNAEGHARLNCRAYRLKMPFVLLCASDGFFDAYDKTGLPVEAKLLGDILGATSAEQLKEALVARYNNNLSDDTSVAFVPVGFDSYEEIRSLLSARRKQMDELYALHRECAPVLALIDKPEFRVTATICDRFQMKFADIIRALTQAYYQGKKESLLTSWWREVIAQSETECRQEFSERARERREQLKKEAAEEIEKRGYAACFRRKIVPGGWITDHVEALRTATEALAKAEAKLASFSSCREKLFQEREELRRNLRAEQRELLSEFLPLVDAPEGAAEDELSDSKLRCSLTFWLNNLSRLELYLFDRKLKLGDAERNGKYRKMFRKAEDYYEHCKRAEADEIRAKSECALCEKEYRAALKKVKDHISTILQERRNLLSAEFIADLDMDAIMFGQIAREELCERVSQKLVQEYAKDPRMIADTLDAYKTSAESCIDYLFPASRLADFRKYYLYRGEAGSEKYVSYRARLAAYEEGTDALLRAPAAPEQGEGDQKQNGESIC